jgi:hypothetical protein
MRVSGKTEEYNALQALEARRRRLPLEVRTYRPLRKSKRMPKSEMRRLKSEVLAQLSGQIRGQRRRAFRGRVALDLEIEIPVGRHQAGLAPVAKAYIDALAETAFDDDDVVDHLIVLSRRSLDGSARVAVRCQPLQSFLASYDLSSRVGEELELHDSSAHPTEVPWGLRGFDSDDVELLRYDESLLARIAEINAEEVVALDEDEDAGYWPDLASSEDGLADPDLRESLAAHLKENIGLTLGRKLTDQGFDAHDRPGLPPAFLNEVAAADLAELERQPLDHPGCFRLPPPPERKRCDGEAPWRQGVRRAFAARLVPPHDWGRALFGEALAFDVAVLGGAAADHDLDNLTHTLIGAFNEVFAHAEPLITGYRAYRAQAERPEVRLRVLPVARLQLLSQSLARSEELILVERASRSRA